jgi:hypothetical protein
MAINTINPAFSMVISSAHIKTTKEDILRVFDQLDFGIIERVDMVDANSRGYECKKIFIHYSSSTSKADRLRARLDDNDERQKKGEIVPPIKIVYNRTRDGRDQYWKVYKAKTLAEHHAELTAKTATFVPRIEM